MGLWWDYVFNQGLDTVVGCLVALWVSLLFWPRNTWELQSLEHRLLGELQEQLHRYAGWLQGECERPAPLSTAPLTSAVDKMSVLVERERRGPRPTLLRSSRWRQRLRLWQIVQFHWIAWERLIEGLPDLEVREPVPSKTASLGCTGSSREQGLPQHDDFSAGKPQRRPSATTAQLLALRMRQGPSRQPEPRHANLVDQPRRIGHPAAGLSTAPPP